MNIITQHWRRIATILSMLTLLAVVTTPVSAAYRNPGVVPPNARFMGKSYGEWHAAWWRWAFSIPVDQSPFNDPTGANCAVGQSGHVWFLAGTVTTTEESGVIVGEEHRSCTVSSGTALLFPLLNTESSTLEGNGDTEQELQASASNTISFVTDLNATIDGTPLANLRDYRAQSPLFSFGPLPANALFGLPANESTQSVADGYMVLLTPLSVGTHTITFGGRADLTSVEGPLFIQKISYTSTVIPDQR
jgi:hypothetical protein